MGTGLLPLKCRRSPSRMNRKHDLILLDLDGTISDPIRGIAKSINYALAALDFGEVAQSRVVSLIGMPIDETLAALSESESSSVVNQLVVKYRERFAAIGYSENSLYPGVHAALIDLHEKKVPLAICTSKRSDYAEKILQMFGLDSLFRFVNGGDVGITKQEQIAQMLVKGQITENTMMIGDRSVDLAAAHAGGLTSAGALWGYGSREELERENPSRLFESPEEWHILEELTKQGTGNRGRC